MSEIALRLRLPTGSASTLRLPPTAKYSELVRMVAKAAGCADEHVRLSKGFPPTAIQPAQGAEQSVADVVQHMDTISVQVANAAPAAAQNPSGGSGRRKPQQVRRVAPGSQAADPGATHGGSSSAPNQADSATDTAAAARTSASARPAKRPRGAASEEERDPLEHTLRAEKEAAGKAKAAAGRMPKHKSCEQMTREYCVGPATALQLAARGGSTSGDFLTEHGMIEHRIAALAPSKFEAELISHKQRQVLRVSFSAVRRQVTETVQYLSLDELPAVLRAIASRGSSSRRGPGRLLGAREMAARSPALFWSVAHAFGGDVDGGVQQLLGTDDTH